MVLSGNGVVHPQEVFVTYIQHYIHLKLELTVQKWTQNNRLCSTGVTAGDVVKVTFKPGFAKISQGELAEFFHGRTWQSGGLGVMSLANQKV